MKYLQKLFSILLILGMLFGFTTPGMVKANTAQLAISQVNPISKFESLVYSQLESGPADFFVNMVEQADLQAANQIMSKEEKGSYVYNALVTTANRSQADLRTYLEKYGVEYQSFYIINTILVKMGTMELATAIAARPEVAGISANHPFQLDEPMINQDVFNQPEAVEPNISFVKANQVWSMGFSGQGTVMAGNDTGLYWSHPALISQYRGCLNPPECTSIDHNYNWWDATGTYPSVPNDGHGHGTHTTGTMVGDDGGANQIGMAPGARTVHCKNMTNSGSGSDATFLTCFQWDLAPWDLAGQNPRPDLAPDAINNSWGYWGGGQNQFRGAVDALLAAGIVVEVSSGNEGPSCQTLRSPGDYLEVFTTGSINHASAWPGSLTGFSSRGPSSLDGGYFPDFMAPGENIRSSVPGGGYEGGWSGTSMAGPHVTALIGLIWSANPALRGQIQTTYDIIQQTVSPLTGQNGSNCGGDYTVGPNNDWGYGTIDALAAVQLAITYGGAGVLEGTVIDSVSGLPVAGAAITAARQEGGSWPDTTDENGFYQITVAAGTFDVTASHPHYVNQTVNNVVVVEDSTTVQDIQLEPRGLLFGYVTDFDNGFALAGATVAADNGSSTTSDANGYYEMYLDEGVYQVTATLQDYAPEVASVEIFSGESRQQDFALLAAISVVPDPIVAVVTLGETGSVNSAATNNLPQEYPFEFLELEGGIVNRGQMITGSGGPDPFGYTFVDSNEPGGARFEWVDATDGTALGLADDGEANVTLPFSFSFYGTAASDLRVGNNGGVLFNVTSGDVSVTNGDLGSTTTNNFFAPFWDDIDSDTGDVYYKTVGTAPYRQFIIEWYNRPHYSNVGNATFELILYETTNNIKYQYQDVVFGNSSYDYGASATAGIRQTGIYYLQYSYNQPVIQDSMAICFVYPGSAPCDGGDVLWFGESIPGGMIPADGGMLNWVTTFDASEAAGINEPGEYHATLRLQPTTGGLPVKVVPVVMTVLPTNTQGLLEGTVTSDRPGGALVADILIESSGGMTWTLTTDADGYYQKYLEEGDYFVTAASAGYLPQTALVSIVGQQTTTQDFILVRDASNIVVDPLSFEVTVELGQSSVELMNIANLGVEVLNFEISERNGEFLPNTAGEDILVVAHDTSAAAAMEAALVNLGYTYLQVTDAEFQAMTVEQLLEYLAVFHAGTSGTSGSPGPSELLLMAYLDSGGALFISDNDLGYWRHDYAFYDTYLQSIYDIDDGGAYVDGLDLMAGLTLDISADPYPDGITARVEGIPIFQFQGSVEQGGVAIDRNGYHAVYTAFDFQNIADPAQEVEVIDRVLSFIVAGDVLWITEEPISGSVDAGGDEDITLSFNAGVVAEPGTYSVDLQIKNNDPYNSKVTVPVIMHVTPPEDIGRLEGTITGMGYCDAESNPLEAQVVIENSSGMTWTVTSDPDTGYYFQWLPVDTYTVTASAAGHRDASGQAVVISQQTTTLDLALRYIESCMDISPTSFTITMGSNTQLTQTLSVHNNGAGELNWEIHETTATLRAENVAPVLIGGDPFGKVAANTVGKTSGSTPLMAPQEVLVQEGFEAGIVPPTDWMLIQTNPRQTWKIQTAVIPYEGSYLADVEYDTSLEQQDEVLISPELMLQSGVLDIWSFGSLYWCRDTYDNCDLNIWIVVGDWDGGAGDDIYVGKADDDWTATWAWSNSVFDLTPLLPGVPVRIAFQYYGLDGAQVGLDAILLDGQLGNLWTDVPWVSEVPTSGLTLPDSTFDVDVVFDSTGLTPGECYNASLGLVHDDPGKTSPLFIPLNLCILLPEYGVDLDPETSNGTGAPGDVVEYTLQLTNTGNVADTFELSYNNVNPGWLVELPVSTFDLGVGESVDVTVYVTIPDGAGNGAVDSFTLTATSVNDSLATDDVEITTTVEIDIYNFWLPVINKG